jgi:sugar/nucleoside kinase (ribokinase family)
VVLKRGEYGSALITADEGLDGIFLVSAYPVEMVVDPTGAGDTFAAGFMGYLARTGDLSARGLRRAVIHGSLAASFTVEDFSIDRLRGLTLADIEARYARYRRMTQYDSAPDMAASPPGA